jgi:anti-sigma regulatory factor (Ser/Thr protein kinase)
VHRLDLSVPATPDAAGTARASLGGLRRELADRLDLERGGELYADVRLLATELVNNAVTHAGMRPQDLLTLRLRMDERILRLEVVDSGPGFVPTAPRNPGWGESGRGLLLVDRMSDRWGVSRNSPFCVWLEIDLERDADAA